MINLEKSMKYGDRISGHFVQGHIDTTAKVNNIKIVDGSFKEGFPNGAPFDRIIIDTPIKEVSKKILNQLSPILGKIIMIKKITKDLGKAEKITMNNNNISNEFLFDVFSKYELYSEVEEFIFWGIYI